MFPVPMLMLILKIRTLAVKVKGMMIVINSSNNSSTSM